MAVTLTGVLKDPYGHPLPGATIRFDAVRTSATVLNHIRAEAITDAQGDYSISVEVGRYDVRVMQGRSFLELAKNLEVRADSTATDLNELVVEWQGEQDLTPGIVIEFRALVDEARGYRDEAVASAGEAAASESNAADSASAASESASNAATSEQNAASSASAASASESSATDSADAASTSEANAASSASAAAASEGSAATSASNAADSASAAAASESNAAGSESAADDSALEAQHWAQYPNDTPVPEGDGSQFSAAHWAEVSRQRAVNAMVAQGAWDASTGSLPPEPTGASYWLVTGAANGETIGGVEYRNKDMLLWTPNESGGGGTWSKIDNTDSVASVAGKTGAVTLVPGDVGADPAGTASSAVATHEAKSSAHTPAQVGADPAGSAASAEQAAKDHADTKASEAQAYAVQRANHTGMQPLSTISDAGTAAAASAECLSNSPYCTDTGTADAYALSVNYLNATPTAYNDGDQYRFRAGASNAGASTVNINGLGAKPLVTVTGVALPAGYIRTDVDTKITYDAANERFITDRAPENGENANGWFTRWANGRASAHRREVQVVNTDVSSGALYAGGVSSRLFPCVFTSIWTIDIFCDSETSEANLRWVAGNFGEDLTLTRWPSVFICDSSSSNASTEISYNVEGLWYES
ncbi:prophage tail fiber N-terminal domain-containing protein [Halomonas sp. H33-56]|uniref:prophage tail fiber N-terminal domain-containing protein n=1 Tax=Halomonas sp. H33-56 TaxID=2950873 RepID=UPI0032DFBBA6